MAEHGFDAWWPHDKLAVRGYVEVLRHYREIAGIRDELAARLLADRPAAFIGVDAPDFNLGLEARLKAAGIKTIHFVCPSIWAWRGGRAQKMARSVRPCAVPVSVRARAAAPRTACRPAMWAIRWPMRFRCSRRATSRARSAGPATATTRWSRCCPAAGRRDRAHRAGASCKPSRCCTRQRPALRFVLPVAPGLQPAARSRWSSCTRPDVPLLLLDGQSHEALAACDVTLIASGTATLEAALFKRPMVIAYRMHALSWQLMKRMHYQPWVGLPNILCGEFVVPELHPGRLQRPQRWPTASSRWLDDTANAARLRRALRPNCTTCCRRDTARCATDAIAQDS